MTPAARPSKQAGMTLVEVMLVVFIVGLVAGVAVMTLPDRPDPQERAVRDLGQAVREVQDMAVLTGDALAISAVDGKVSLVRWDGFDWQPAGRDLASLPQGVSVRLVRPGETGRDNERGERLLVFDPLGVSEPADIIVSAGAFERTLHITPDGEVRDGQSG